MKVITNVQDEKKLNVISQFVKERLSLAPEIVVLKDEAECAKQEFRENILVLDSGDFSSLLYYVASGAGLICPVFLYVRDTILEIPCPYGTEIWAPVLKNSVLALSRIIKRRIEEDAPIELLTESMEEVRTAYDELFKAFEEAVRKEVKNMTDEIL